MVLTALNGAEAGETRAVLPALDGAEVGDNGVLLGAGLSRLTYGEEGRGRGTAPWAGWLVMVEAVMVGSNG